MFGNKSVLFCPIYPRAYFRNVLCDTPNATAAALAESRPLSHF